LSFLFVKLTANLTDTLDDEINGMQYVSTTQNFDNTSDANLNAFLFGTISIILSRLNSDAVYHFDLLLD
jgi:hypothetical protein